jgi:hypothetical protein
MYRIVACLFAVFFLMSLLAMPVSSEASTFSASQSVAITGVIGHNDRGFQMRGAFVSSEVFIPGSTNYQPNAWQLLKSVGINTICVDGGTEGDIAHLNINTYPNEWAPNLNNFLSAADQNGIKVYFNNLGKSWGTLFGIISPGDTLGPYPPTPIAQAEAMVDDLAGNNLLGHDFITDTRVVGWRTSNEVNITDPTILNWNLQLADYIRSKGGKAWLSSPYFGGDWTGGYNFRLTEPLLQGHVDFLEAHYYLLSEFISSGMDYTAYYNFCKSYLQTAMVQSRGDYSLSHVILGEFGMWEGSGSDSGINATFTDAERQIYYQAIFDAARDAGIQNIVLFDFFTLKKSDGTCLTPNYGVVDTSGRFYPYLYNVIQNAYSSG